MDYNPDTSKSNRWFWLALAILLVSALLIRVVTPYLGKVQSSDPTSYIGIGVNLAIGDGFTDEEVFLQKHTAWRAPLTSFVFAACYALSGNNQDNAVFGFLKLQQVLSVLSILFLVLISIQIHGDRMAALFAGGLMAFHLENIDLTKMVLSETLFIFFELSCLLVFILAVKKQKGSLFALSGLLAGFAMLARAALTLFMIVIVLYLLYEVFFRQEEWARIARLKHLVLFAGCTLLVVAPWIARNTYYNHTLTLVTSNAGFNMYLENSGKENVWPEMIHKSQNEWADLTEGQKDKIYMERTLISISNNPGAYVEKIAGRLYRMMMDVGNLFLFFIFGFYIVQKRAFYVNIPVFVMLFSFVITYAMTFYSDRFGATMTPLFMLYIGFAFAVILRYAIRRWGPAWMIIALDEENDSMGD